MACSCWNSIQECRGGCGSREGNFCNYNWQCQGGGGKGGSKKTGPSAPPKPQGYPTAKNNEDMFMRGNRQHKPPTDNDNDNGRNCSCQNQQCSQGCTNAWDDCFHDGNCNPPTGGGGSGGGEGPWKPPYETIAQEAPPKGGYVKTQESRPTDGYCAPPPGSPAAAYTDCSFIDNQEECEDEYICNWITSMPGDVNLDGQVNVNDLIQIIDHILENEMPAAAEGLYQADYNNDGLITISDAVAVVEHILNGIPQQQRAGMQQQLQTVLSPLGINLRQESPPIRNKNVTDNISRFPQPLQGRLRGQVAKVKNRISNTKGNRGVYHETTGWSYSQSTEQYFVIFEAVSPLGVQSQLAPGNTDVTQMYSDGDYTMYGYRNDLANDIPGGAIDQWSRINGVYNHPDSIIGVFYNGHSAENKCVGWIDNLAVENDYHITIPIMIDDGTPTSTGHSYGVPSGTPLSELEFKYYHADTGEITDLILSPIGLHGVNFSGNYAYPPYDEIGGLFPGVFGYMGDSYKYQSSWDPCPVTFPMNIPDYQSCRDVYAFPHTLDGQESPNYCSCTNVWNDVIEDFGCPVQNLDIQVISGLSIAGHDVYKEDFCHHNGVVPYINCNWIVPMDIGYSATPTLASIPILKGDNSIDEILGTDNGFYKIIGEGEAAQYNPVSGWVGSLDTINPFSAYWLFNENTGANYEWNAIGRCLTQDYSEIIYDLHFGANMVSYPYDYPLSVEEALSGKEEYVLGVIGMGEALKYEIHDTYGPGWYGNLEWFLPGRGYWIIMNYSHEFDWLPEQRIITRNSTNNQRNTYRPLAFNNHLDEKEKRLRKSNLNSRFHLVPLDFELRDDSSLDNILDIIDEQIDSYYNDERDVGHCSCQNGECSDTCNNQGICCGLCYDDNVAGNWYIGQCGNFAHHGVTYSKSGMPK